MSNKENFNNRTDAFNNIRIPIAPVGDIIVPKTRYKRQKLSTNDLMHLDDCICEECCAEDGINGMEWG